MLIGARYTNYMWSKRGRGGSGASHRRHWASADLPADQETGAAIRAAAKQLAYRAASLEMSLMLAVPYPSVPELDLKRPSKGQSGPEHERSEARGNEALLRELPWRLSNRNRRALAHPGVSICLGAHGTIK
jgi:hypothetical protein